MKTAYFCPRALETPYGTALFAVQCSQNVKPIASPPSYKVHVIGRTGYQVRTPDFWYDSRPATAEETAKILPWLKDAINGQHWRFELVQQSRA